jgi:cytochrome P450
MEKPSTYTMIRAHALKAMESYREYNKNNNPVPNADSPLIERLWTHHQSQKVTGLDDLDIAAECSDHFLAGIDTTSDTLMFLIWALSRVVNREYQEKLRIEARSITANKLNEDGNPTVETCVNDLPYLDAVVKETLRLYAPLPASEPRELPQDASIDGYMIPARTVVSMSPYPLHRNAAVFPDPLMWNPERWLPTKTNAEQLAEMKRWWWAFSSGGRMCIGMHLAFAEMAIVPAIYRRFSTRIKPEYEDVSPGITSRFEVFYDETFQKMEEHNCWIVFDKLSD